MKKLVKNKIILVFYICIIVLGLDQVKAQNVPGIQYVNPLPNSSFVSPKTNILIRQGSFINKASIDNNLVVAIGAKSGVHKGKIVLADDSRTIIFTPFVPFQTDEDVTVILNDGLITNDGVEVGTLSFGFHTVKEEKTLTSEDKFPIFKNNTFELKRTSFVSVADTILPSDLPRVIINTSNDPSSGYFFLSASPYLEIIDNEGTPVFYRNVGGDIYDFDLQPDGELTYFVSPGKCYGLNSSFDQVREFNTINGYTVNIHELRVLQDGSYYIFGTRMVQMDLSNIVSGGDTAAQIIDGALQEFDSGGYLIFQWDALDHYSIEDVDRAIDLTQHVIDFAHFNSLAIDYDGNFLLSARNFDEITKVDHNTGNIIWRWGGENNQFTFINDTLLFSRQHDIRLLSNGNVTLFDNGIFNSPPTSNAVEYKLDETNKTANLIRRIFHDNLFTKVGGSFQEMQNDNVLIGWGTNWKPAVTEITPEGSVAFEMSYTEFLFTYRALKYQWKTTLFTTNVDSLDFGNVAVGDSLQKQFTVYNPQNTDVTINEFFCIDSSFSTTLKVPVTIKAHDSLVVPVVYKPLIDGSSKVSFNVRNIGRNGYEQMIARQVILSGETDNVSVVNSIVHVPKQFMLYQNYPNPFNPSTVIKFEIPRETFVTLKIYDVLGRLVKSLVNEEKPAGDYSINFNAANFSNGVYFYRLKAGNYSQVRKMVLLK